MAGPRTPRWSTNGSSTAPAKRAKREQRVVTFRSYFVFCSCLGNGLSQYGRQLIMAEAECLQVGGIYMREG